MAVVSCAPSQGPWFDRRVCGSRQLPAPAPINRNELNKLSLEGTSCEQVAPPFGPRYAIVYVFVVGVIRCDELQSGTILNIVLCFAFIFLSFIHRCVGILDFLSFSFLFHGFGSTSNSSNTLPFRFSG